MNEPRHLITREDQFRTREVVRRIAAAAPIEEKVATLIELQKISSELAKENGRPAKKPWQIQILSR